MEPWEGIGLHRLDGGLVLGGKGMEPGKEIGLHTLDGGLVLEGKRMEPWKEMCLDTKSPHPVYGVGVCRIRGGGYVCVAFEPDII